MNTKGNASGRAFNGPCWHETLVNKCQRSYTMTGCTTDCNTDCPQQPATIQNKRSLALQGTTTVKQVFIKILDYDHLLPSLLPLQLQCELHSAASVQVILFVVIAAVILNHSHLWPGCDAIDLVFIYTAGAIPPGSDAIVLSVIMVCKSFCAKDGQAALQSLRQGRDVGTWNEVGGQVEEVDKHLVAIAVESGKNVQ